MLAHKQTKKKLKMSNVQTLLIYDACPLKSKPIQRVQTNVTKVLHRHKSSLSGRQLQLKSRLLIKRVSAFTSAMDKEKQEKEKVHKQPYGVE